MVDATRGYGDRADVSENTPLRAGSVRVLATPAIQAALLILAAFAIRWSQFGNSAIQVDEEFYLLVGDRMWHHALPYVDIWDRKPFGLFLLYAAIRGLGGDGIVQYQVAATISAAMTALAATRMATRIAPAGAAMVAGLLYLLCLGLSGGQGGQSPVFYNLPVAVAAWLVLRAIERPARADILGGGCLAMALLGIAMQIKQTALFEGCYLGIVLLVLAWRFRPRAVALIGTALLWLAIALAPSAASWAWYHVHGAGAAYDYANFVSIFQRVPEPRHEVLIRLWTIILRATPLIACAIAGWWTAARRGGAGAAHGMLIGWAAAASVGMLVFGTYYDHYALPLYAPLCVAAAPAFDGRGLRLGRGRRLPVALLLLLTAGIASGVLVRHNVLRHGNGSQQRAIATFLKPRLKDCLFVFSGEPILYYLTDSCLPTRWAFPSHLADKKEQSAIGVDPLAEVRRIMARHPRYVVWDDPAWDMINLQTWTYMQIMIAHDYREVFRVRIGKHDRLVMERLPGR